MIAYIPTQGSSSLHPIHIGQVPIVHLGMVRLPLGVTGPISPPELLGDSNLQPCIPKFDALPTELSQPLNYVHLST